MGGATFFTESMAWRAALLLPLLLLADCSSRPPSRVVRPTQTVAKAAPIEAPERYYAPPGPPDDPWGPYIREASERFDVPERWVRAVMHQESGGEEQAISPVGAMGLMQVMPDTYDELRERYNLGDDPYDPHNNMLAGVAYIHEMYEKYGAPGFLAAYDAGPGRVDDYLAGSSRLPEETVNYLAAITPHLGTEVAFSGPFASYASLKLARRSIARPVTVASLASGCDLDAAYDPKHPCNSLERAAVTPAKAPVQMASATYCDPDAAYDPSRHCRYVPDEPPVPPTPPARPSAGSGKVVLAAVGGGGWAIQVGAFRNTDLARAVAEGARSQAPGELRAAAFSFPPITSSSGTMLYRARLVHLSANAASNACQALNKRQLPCIVVQPGGA